jgi:hypothetical protein
MSNDALPPDVQAARKARINDDLIKLCSTPAPPYSLPTAHGVGLYTHVAGPKTASQNPHFNYTSKPDGEVALLPLGGPRKIIASKPQQSPNEKVAAVYKELQDAVSAEEKIWKDMRDAADTRGDSVNDAYTMSLDALKRKYGDLDAPEEGDMPHLVSTPHDKRRISAATGDTSDEALKRSKADSSSQQSDSRRPSGDVVEGETDMTRRGEEVQAS